MLDRVSSVGPERRWSWDVAVVGGLVGTTFFVHAVSYVTSQPYWLDEAFVVSLAKSPLSRLFELDRSTPLGWAFLTHLVPGRGEEQRLVPLVLAAGAAGTAYVLGRGLPWRSTAVARVAGAIVGITVLLSPAMLVRNDLKQYTGDAFFALLILALTSRAEADPSRRTLAQLAVVSIFSIFFSAAAEFVVLAVFAGLFLAACASKVTARIRDVALAGATVGLVMVIYVEAIVLPRTPPSFYAYWNSWYLTGGAGHIISQSWHRVRALAPMFAMPTLLLGALCALGLVTLLRLHRPALAFSMPLLWAEMVVLGVARRYPFLDVRTSTFLFVITVTFAAIGFSGVVVVLATRSRWLTATLVLVSALGYGYRIKPYVRIRSIPYEDVRSVTRFVAHNRAPGDVIIVSFASNWGFSYYWPHGHTSFTNEPLLGQGFTTQVIGLPRVVYAGQAKPTLREIAKTRTYPVEYAFDALRQALAFAHEPGASGRIWLVRSHLGGREAARWNEAFRTFHVVPTLRRVGIENVAVIDVQPAETRAQVVVR